MRRRGVTQIMKWLAAMVVLYVPATAAAEGIWCGTSLDARAPVWRSAPRLRQPHIVTRVEHVHFADEREPRARTILADAATSCGAAGATWSVTVIVAPNGTVIEAHAVGAQAACVRDSLRSLRFPRGGVRTIAAQLTLALAQ